MCVNSYGQHILWTVGQRDSLRPGTLFWWVIVLADSPPHSSHPPLVHSHSHTSSKLFFYPSLYHYSPAASTPHSHMETLKTDTSVRLRGRRQGVKELMGGGGVGGCILGLMLNEAVCSLGNAPLQMSNKTPFFFPPSCFHSLLKQRRKGRISGAHKHCKVLLIPPPSPVSSVFTLYQWVMRWRSFVLSCRNI